MFRNTEHFVEEVMLVANFCLECWCKKHKTADFPENYVISEQAVLCEKCGNWTNIIVKERKKPLLRRLFPYRIGRRDERHTK